MSDKGFLAFLTIERAVTSILISSAAIFPNKQSLKNFFTILLTMEDTIGLYRVPFSRKLGITFLDENNYNSEGCKYGFRTRFNTEILAARDGIVKEAGESILIEHGDGEFSRYENIISKKTLVKKGNGVKSGEPIGYSEDNLCLTVFSRAEPDGLRIRWGMAQANKD